MFLRHEAAESQSIIDILKLQKENNQNSNNLRKELWSNIERKLPDLETRQGENTFCFFTIPHFNTRLLHSNLQLNVELATSRSLKKWERVRAQFESNLTNTQIAVGIEPRGDKSKPTWM